jgi:Rod binding domain-containing protein
MHVELNPPVLGHSAPQSRNSQVGTAADTHQMKKLRKAASEFEAMLISNWWSTMKESGMGDSEESTDPGKSTLDQMGITALSSAIATGKGGLGLGEMLVKSLLPRETGAAGVPAK